MANRDYVFTSESVSEGHPDKICDRISDAIVDTFLAAEPEARCGVETLVTTNRVVLAGEVRGPVPVKTVQSHASGPARFTDYCRRQSECSHDKNP